MGMLGTFSEEAQELWDFARCQRADGTFYGSPSGNCKKGSKVSSEEGKKEKMPTKEDAVKAVKWLKKQLKAVEDDEFGGYTLVRGGKDDDVLLDLESRDDGDAIVKLQRVKEDEDGDEEYEDVAEFRIPKRKNDVEVIKAMKAYMDEGGSLEDFSGSSYY